MTSRPKPPRAPRPERPDLTDAFRGSKSPGPLVSLLTAGAFLLGAALLFAMAWGLAELGAPMIVIATLGIALLSVVFVLLQRSVRD